MVKGKIVLVGHSEGAVVAAGIALLGRGAFAEVWKAWQSCTRKWVAVKVFTQRDGVNWLCRGAFAEVWKAWQSRTRKWVAVKVFTRRDGVNWLFLQREVERLIRLDKHPHIVSPLDADLAGEPAYYAMDFMAGGSPEQFVGAGKAATPQ